MSDKATKIILILVVAISWSFLIIMTSKLRIYLITLTVIAFLVLVIIITHNYIFLKKCRKILTIQGGLILSHNNTYSCLRILRGSIKTEIFIQPYGKPATISFTTELKSKDSLRFCLRRNDFFNKMSRKLEKKLDIIPDNNLILDNKFVITENNIPSILMENLLLPVKKDLLESLKASPAIDLYHNKLTIIFIDSYPDDLRLERYLRIVHVIVDSINKSS
jgi:hypothetical protein